MNKATLCMISSAIAAAFTSIGCGGVDIGPGEVDIFRVETASDVKASGTCAMTNPDHTSTTDIATGSSIMAYGTSTDSGDKLYLDIGGKVFAGAQQDDGSYKFSGTATQTDTQAGSTTTQKTAVTITFTLDGDTLTGSESTHSTSTCSGGNLCNGFMAADCTQSVTFSGTAVDNAELIVN